MLAVGATDGLLALAALERIGDGWVHVVDPSVPALEDLERRAAEIGASGIAYLVGGLCVLPLPDAAVDAVLTRPPANVEDRDEAARELYRVLRPGGRLSLVDATDHDSDELTRALQNAGFADVQLERERGVAFVRARRP